MRPVLNWKILCVALAALLLFQPLSIADEAQLSNIVVTNNRDDLLLYVNASGAFREKTKKAILSGVQTTFTFYIILNSARSYWLNKKIVDIKVAHSIEYDNLKKEFRVIRSWNNGEPAVTRSFEEAQQLMV